MSTPTMTLNRALLRKEVRMQYPALFAGLAFALLTPLLLVAVFTAGPRFNYDLLGGLSMWMALVWPFVAVAAGALSLAGEFEDKTAGFLLSRPVTRLRVWCVKVIASINTLVVTALFSLLVRGVVSWWVGPPSEDSFRYASDFDWWIHDPFAMVGMVAIMFASALLCSTIIRRPLTAAAGGVAVALGLAAVLLFVWSIAGVSPRFEPQWMGMELLMLAVVVVLASGVVFCWPERDMVADGVTRATFGTSAVLLLGVGALPVWFGAITPQPGAVEVLSGSATYNNGGIIATVRDPRGTTQVWRIYGDGSGTEPFAPRHTFAPMWLASSNRFLFFSRRNAWGADAEAVRVRVSQPPAFDSWSVVDDIEGTPTIFSGLGWREGRFAFTQGTELTIGRLNGYGHEVRDIAGTPLQDATLLGFSRVSLVYVSGDFDVSTGALRRDGELFLYDVDTEATTIVQPLPAGSVLGGGVRRWRGRVEDAAPTSRMWSTDYLLAIPGEDGGADVRLVRRALGFDSESHTVLEIADAWSDDAGRRMFHRCSAVEVAPSRRWFDEDGRRRSEPQGFFGDCSEPTREIYPAGAIRMVGQYTGEETVWPLPTGWSGSIHRMYLHRNGEIILLDMRGPERADDYVMTLRPDGTFNRYPGGWVAMGWTPFDDTISVKRDDGETIVFGIADEQTGQVYEVFPNNEWRPIVQQRIRDREAAGQQ